jgi:hypothetical protein
MSYGAYRKHLAAAEAYDARARAHRARAERHRSLAFGEHEEDEDERWRYNVRYFMLHPNEESLYTDDEKALWVKEMEQYNGKRWNELPADVQERVAIIHRPPKARKDEQERFWNLVDEENERHARQEAAKQLVGGVLQRYKTYRDSVVYPGDDGYIDTYEPYFPTAGS